MLPETVAKVASERRTSQSDRSQQCGQANSQALVRCHCKVNEPALRPNSPLFRSIAVRLLRATSQRRSPDPARFADRELLAGGSIGAGAAGADFRDVLPYRSLNRFVESNGAFRDFTQCGHTGLVVALDEGNGPVGQLTRSLGPNDHQGEAVVDFLQTIFNSYASQEGLQGEVGGPDIRAEVGKVKGGQAPRILADSDLATLTADASFVFPSSYVVANILSEP